MAVPVVPPGVAARELVADGTVLAFDGEALACRWVETVIFYLPISTFSLPTV